MRGSNYTERVIQPMEDKEWQAELVDLLRVTQQTQDVQTALTCLIDYGKSCVQTGRNPSLCIGFWDGGAGLRQMRCANDEQKRKLQDEITSWLFDRNAVCALVLADAWQSKDPTWKGRPSESPCRTEALLCMVVRPDGSVETALEVPYTREASHITWSHCHTPQNTSQGILRPWQPRIGLVDEQGNVAWGVSMTEEQLMDYVQQMKRKQANE